MKKIFIGAKNADGSMEIFKSEAIPTMESHGKLYCMCTGPFRTMRGAKFFRDFSRNNPNIQSVNDAERIAKQAGK